MLRPYQSDTVSRVRVAFSQGARSVLMVAPTGAGKTVMFSYITNSAAAKGRRVMILVHRQELLDQCSRTLTENGVSHGFVASGRSMNQIHGVQVASVQTLVRRLDTIVPPDLIIVDECFPAGTLVDGMPIEKRKIGDVVKTHLGHGAITHVFKNPAPALMVRIVTSSGKRLVMTGNHPVWTSRGFINASGLTNGDMVATITPYEQVHCVRSGNNNEKAVLESKVQVGAFAQDNSEHFQKARGNNSIPKNERNERPEDEGKGFNKAQGDGVASNNSRREREAASGPPNSFGGCAWLANGSGDSNWTLARLRLSDLLQGGHWKPCFENSDRSGWRLSQFDRPNGQGQEEDGVLGIERVESVEIQKQNSGDGHSGVCGRGFVYNLEVQNGNTFFANNVLVHNCHHAVSGTFKKTLAAFPAARILGVSATPERLDGRGLGSTGGGPFDVMVQGPTAADLIAGGYLSAPVYYAPPSTVDATRLHSVGGDFNRGEAAAEFDKPKITGDAVQHYTRIAPGAPAVAFCITIEHAKHVASEFRAAGYRADTIDGTLSDCERRDRVASLADGRLHVLTSCEIINEGFDLPVATVAILLRPTQSLGLHLQQIGRVLRPVYAPGAPLDTAEDRLAALKSGPKPQAIILDHVGNLHRHGLAEQPRDWSLDGYCEKRQKKLDADVLTIRNRQCPKCYAMHAPAPACPQCGEVYESKREIETVAGELVPLGASATVRADAWAQCPACQTVHRADLGQCPSCNKDHAKDRRREIGRADTLESLIALGKQRGYKNPYAWASHLMRARGLRAKISKANDS